MFVSGGVRAARETLPLELGYWHFFTGQSAAPLSVFFSYILTQSLLYSLLSSGPRKLPCG